jgi:hypothetical protein
MARGTGYQLSQYEPLIVQSARQNGISPNLLRSILKQESNFDPSQTGQQTHLGTAKGIAQLTPDTQAELGVKNPYDPNEAIPAAARYLAKYRQVGVDKGAANPDAYAAMVYNGGPGFNGPDEVGYATSVLNHAGNFAQAGAGGQQGVIRGSANFAKAHPDMFGGDPSQPGWEDKNLTTISSPSGVKFRVNGAAAGPFQGFINELEGRGYNIDPAQSSGYAARNIRGGHDLSEHAYGNAIDVNAASNPMTAGGGPMQTNLPPNVGDIAARHGLVWGGDWTTRKDPMHFEWAGPDTVRLASAGVSDIPEWTTRPRPAEAAGPSAAGAPQGLRPTAGPLPANWADVPGAPASMSVAPPSAFTASSPAEQARWNAVSTPQGYEAAVRALAGMGTSSPASRVTEDPGRSVPTVIPRTGPSPGGPPVITGPGSPPPPEGGWRGWAGVPGAAGSPSGPADPIAALAAVGRGEVTPASYWQGQPPPQAGRGDYVAPAGPAGPAGPLVSSPTQPVYNQATSRFEQVPRPPAVEPGAAAATPAAGNRTLSDEQLARMGPEDVYGVVTNQNLTYADQKALIDRLGELQRQQSNGGQ